MRAGFRIILRMTDLARLLFEARRSLASDLSADLAARGYPDIRPAHAGVFSAIDRRSGTRLADLASQIRLTKQATMQLVDELEVQGYVRRVPDPSDARAKLVRLTAHGRRAAAESRRAEQWLQQRTRRRLGERAYEGFRRSLEILATSEG
jgi:DNA-binding MarR family transcriptional regulator